MVVDVLANDSDPDTDPLTVDSVTQGTNGSVVNNGTDVTYTPNASWTGVDTFTYTATDSNGGFDTAIVTVTVGSVAPVVLDNVQSGATTISHFTSSTSVTIAAVDMSKSFLTFSVRENSASAANMWVTGELVNPTTVTFQREGNSGAVSIEWSVVEFSSGVSVQRGASVMSAATTNVPIASTDLSKSFVIVSHRAPGTSLGANDFITATLTSATNLQLTMNAFYADDVVLAGR